VRSSGSGVRDRTGRSITKGARQEIIDTVARAVVPEQYLDKKTKFRVNETGKFINGGPQERRCRS
jgi:S-adenosylmethionine synthetase